MLGGGMGRWKIQRLFLNILWTLNIHSIKVTKGLL